MDAFGYVAAHNAAMNGFNLPQQENYRVDGYSPERVELAELLQRLRARYGRRKGFRIADVQNMIEAIRDEKRVARQLEFGIRPTPMIDLTDCDVVIE